ncbi:MAG: hypothetical protein ABGX07_00415, partial [Pirellulaceae bacterium]
MCKRTATRICGLNLVRFIFLVGAISLSMTAISVSGQDNWPRFRGPQADGVAKDDSRLPIQWSKTDNVRWVAEIPGVGWSCPIVWGDRVFLTTVVGEEENVAPKKGLYLGRGVRTP